ncbi:MAG TPA: hypothetical protein VFT57_15810 [Gemmatimonadaceae bacterium]|nr:hypothetical protein [Gemmatimonadaceae bacterium]
MNDEENTMSPEEARVWDAVADLNAKREAVRAADAARRIADSSERDSQQRLGAAIRALRAMQRESAASLAAAAVPSYEQDRLKRYIEFEDGVTWNQQVADAAIRRLTGKKAGIR